MLQGLELPICKFESYYIETGCNLFQCYKILYLVLVEEKLNARQKESRDSNREAFCRQAG